MSKAAVVIRQSQGTDDSVSLDLQREKVPALAGELADEVVTYDLGVHTGFSIHSKDRGAERIDANPQIEEFVDRLRAGDFGYVVAWDDTRIARDEFFAEVKRAAKLGEAEFAFVSDVDDLDSLTHGVKRTVETKVKQEEIEKARAALERKKERGDDLGRPRFGMTYDVDGRRQVPGENFDVVLEILRARSNGATFDEITDELDVARGTVQNVISRREWYVERSKLGEEA